jgi:hypothetical protein
MPQIKTVGSNLLRAIAWVLFAIAVMLFWAGGRAISEFGRLDRVLAEFVGLGLAAACGVLGMMARNVAEGLEEDDQSPSE